MASELLHPFLHADTNSRTRWTRGSFGGGDAFDRRVPRRPLCSSLSELRLRTNGRAFCRIDNQPIRLREPVMHPDVLIIQDPTLLHQKNLFDGLDPSGYVLINSTRGLKELGIGSVLEHLPRGHACTVPATELAIHYVGRPLPNSTLLGGFAAMTGALKLASVAAAIRSKFPGMVGESNAAAAEAAYELVAHRDTREEAHVEAN